MYPVCRQIILTIRFGPRRELHAVNLFVIGCFTFQNISLGILLNNPYIAQCRCRPVNIYDRTSSGRTVSRCIPGINVSEIISFNRSGFKRRKRNSRRRRIPGNTSCNPVCILTLMDVNVPGWKFYFAHSHIVANVAHNGIAIRIYIGDADIADCWGLGIWHIKCSLIRSRIDCIAGNSRKIKCTSPANLTVSSPVCFSQRNSRSASANNHCPMSICGICIRCIIMNNISTFRRIYISISPRSMH